MTRTLTAALVATIALSSSAWAEHSLARSLGVEPDTLSRSELALLKSALDDDDTRRVKALLRRAAGPMPDDLTQIGFSDKGAQQHTETFKR